MTLTWLLAIGTGVLLALLLLSQIGRFRDQKRALGSIRESMPPITREERAEWLHYLHVETRVLIISFGLFGVIAEVTGVGIFVLLVLENPPPSALFFWGALSAAVILPTLYIFGQVAFFIASRYYIQRERVMRRRLRD